LIVGGRVIGGEVFAHVDGAGSDFEASELLRELHAVVDRAWCGRRFVAGFDGSVETDASSVEVDADDAGASGLQHKVGSPERGGVGITDSETAAAEAGVTFVHSEGRASGGSGCGFGSGEEFGEAWAGFFEEVGRGHTRISRGAHAVEVASYEDGIATSLPGEVANPGVDFVFSVRTDEAGCGNGGTDRFSPGLPFGDVLGKIVAFGAEELVFAESVGLVADDEGDEAWTQDLRDGIGLVGCSGWRATGEVESIEETPVDDVEEGTEVGESLASEDAFFVALYGGIDKGPLPVVFNAVMDAADLFGVLLADAFPWCDVAEVSAEAKDAVRVEIAEGGDECGVIG